MGKVKIGIYCSLTAGYFDQKCSLSSPLRNVLFLSKCLKFIGCHGSRKAKFANKYIYLEIFSLEAIRGIKLKLCRNVHISHYKSGILIAFAFVLSTFVAMAT